MGGEAAKGLRDPGHLLAVHPQLKQPPRRSMGLAAVWKGLVPISGTRVMQHSASLSLAVPALGEGS